MIQLLLILMNRKYTQHREVRHEYYDPLTLQPKWRPLYLTWDMGEILTHPSVRKLKEHSPLEPLKVGSVVYFVGICKLSFSQHSRLIFGCIYKAIIFIEGILQSRNRALLKLFQ